MQEGEVGTEGLPDTIAYGSGDDALGMGDAKMTGVISVSDRNRGKASIGCSQFFVYLFCVLKCGEE